MGKFKKVPAFHIKSFAHETYLIGAAPLLAALPPRRARRAIPLSLRWGRNADARIVEPLVRTVRVVAGHHVPVGDLVTDAISRLVGVVVPLLVAALGLA